MVRSEIKQLLEMEYIDLRRYADDMHFIMRSAARRHTHDSYMCGATAKSFKLNSALQCALSSAFGYIVKGKLTEAQSDLHEAAAISRMTKDEKFAETLIRFGNQVFPLHIMQNVDAIIRGGRRIVNERSRLETLISIGRNAIQTREVPPNFHDYASNAGYEYYSEGKNITAAFFHAMDAFTSKGLDIPQRLGVAYNCLMGEYGNLFTIDVDSLDNLRRSLKLTQIGELVEYVSEKLEMDAREAERSKGQRRYLGHEVMTVVGILEETRNHPATAIAIYNKAMRKLPRSSQAYRNIEARKEALLQRIPETARQKYVDEDSLTNTIRYSESRDLFSADSAYDVLNVVYQLLSPSDEYGRGLVVQEIDALKHSQPGQSSTGLAAFVRHNVFRTDRKVYPCTARLRLPKPEQPGQGLFGFVEEHGGYSLYPKVEDKPPEQMWLFDPGEVGQTSWDFSEQKYYEPVKRPKLKVLSHPKPEQLYIANKLLAA